jgi:sec-independent protein translocase protein TatB
MFDFDAGKLLILGVVALVVIGPKELPGVMRQVGQAVAKLRRMAAEFQSQFMEAMREAELDDLKKELASVQEAAKIDVDFNPVEDVKREMTAAVTPPSENPLVLPSEAASQIEQAASPLALSQSSEPQPETTGTGQDGHFAAPPRNPDPAAAASPAPTSLGVANPGASTSPASTPTPKPPSEGLRHSSGSRPSLPTPGPPNVLSPSAAPPSAAPPSAAPASAASASVAPPSAAVPDERARARASAPLPGPAEGHSAPPSDSSATRTKKRPREPRREAGAAANSPAGSAGGGEPAATAAPKRKRAAKTATGETDKSQSAAPESAQSRPRRKSGAP